MRVEKDPELGFSISGGVGGRGNPFRPEDDVSLLICPWDTHKFLFINLTVTCINRDRHHLFYFSIV